MLKFSVIIFAVFYLLSPLCFASDDALHISLGDNYGKHAMLVDGKAAGIQKEVLEWFFNEYMHVTVNLESVPWKRAQALVEKTKQSDGYFTAYTDARVKRLKLLASDKPFYTTFVRMHTWKGNPNTLALSQLKTIDDLLEMQHLRHVFLQGSGYHEEQFKDARHVTKLNTIHQITTFLLVYNRADIFVEQAELFYPVAEELGLMDKLQTLDNVNFKKLQWHLFISQESKYASFMKNINENLNKAIAEGVLLAKVKDIFGKYNLSYSE